MDYYGKSVRNSNNELFIKTLEFLDNVVLNTVGEPFRKIDDLTLENLRDFLLAVLQSYRDGKINHMNLKNIVDGVEAFIFEKYGPEYPVFPDVDKRSVSFGVIDCIDGGLLYFFPEDAPFFIGCLEASEDQAETTNKKMKEYIEHLEGLNRYKDGLEKGYLTKIDIHTEKALKDQATSEKIETLTTTYIDSRGNIHKVSEEPSGKYSIFISTPEAIDMEESTATG